MTIRYCVSDRPGSTPVAIWLPCILTQACTMHIAHVFNRTHWTHEQYVSLVCFTSETTIWVFEIPVFIFSTDRKVWIVYVHQLNSVFACKRVVHLCLAAGRFFSSYECGKKFAAECTALAAHCTHFIHANVHFLVNINWHKFECDFFVFLEFFLFVFEFT